MPLVIVRFLSNLWVLIVGVLILCASLAGMGPGLRWLGFAAGCGVAVVLLAAFPLRGRGPRQRGLDGVVMLLAVWTIVASRSFHGATARWLIFGSACALLVVGAVALFVAEIDQARIVRDLAHRYDSGPGAGAIAWDADPEAPFRRAA